jgi:hypothetical protein
MEASQAVTYYGLEEHLTAVDACRYGRHPILQAKKQGSGRHNHITCKHYSTIKEEVSLKVTYRDCETSLKIVPSVNSRVFLHFWGMTKLRLANQSGSFLAH